MPVCNAHTISLFLMSVCIFNTTTTTNCEQSIRDQLKLNLFRNLPDDDDSYDLTRDQLKQNLFRNAKDSEQQQQQQQQQQHHGQSVTFQNVQTTNREDAELRTIREQLKRNLFRQLHQDEDTRRTPAPQPRPYITRRPDPTKPPPSSYSPQSLLSQYNSTCGYTSSLAQGEQNLFHLIAHSDTVTLHYPWLVAIYRTTRTDWEFICGGTLISSKHMISAAHCFGDKNKDIYQFVVTNNLQKDRVVREAKEVLLHPDYLPNTSNADIALIVFSIAVPHDRNIRPICLWLEGRNDIQHFVNVNGLVVGWGNDENNQKSKALPKEVSLPIINYIDCIHDNSKFVSVLGPKSFCAGKKDNSGPCPGDSGSGFVIQRSGRWFLRGVVSSTLLLDRNICNITDYTAMTDVAKYSSWIINIVST